MSLNFVSNKRETYILLLHIYNNYKQLVYQTNSNKFPKIDIEQERFFNYNGVKLSIKR